MKRLTGFGMTLLLGSPLLGSSSAWAHGVTLAKAAELALHRVERLVILCNLGDASQPVNIPGTAGYDPTRCKNDPSKPPKGIDPDYQNKLKDLLVEEIPHMEEDEPSFRITLAQHPGMDTTQRKVMIVLDEEGRPLSNDLVAGSAPFEPTTWPDKDPTTLTENALHYVQDGAAANPDLTPYRDALSTSLVAQEKDSSGGVLVRVDLKAAGAPLILRVWLKTDGTFVRSEFL